jgi:hypothetical protein
MDVTEVAPIIHSQFPEVLPSTVALLGEGCDSWAFEVNRRWVFRFPKRADVNEQLLVESQVLPVLASSSPIPLPAFCFFWATLERIPVPFRRLPEASRCTGHSS